MVIPPNVYANQAHSRSISKRFLKGHVKLLFCPHLVSSAATEHLRKKLILPRINIVKATIVNDAFGTVTFVVENDDRNGEFPTHDRREFHACHLESAVTNERYHLEIGPCHFRTERRRDCKTHRGIVGRRDKFCLSTDDQLASRKERVPHIGNDDRLIVKRFVKSAHESRDGDWSVWLEREGPLSSGGTRRKRACGRPWFCSNEAL